MGKLFGQVRSSILGGEFLVSLHAEERCEERGVTAWQLVADFENAKLVRERPASQPNPSVVVTQLLVDGTEVEAVWAWMPQSRRAKLVTVYDRS